MLLTANADIYPAINPEIIVGPVSIIKSGNLKLLFYHK